MANARTMPSVPSVEPSSSTTTSSAASPSPAARAAFTAFAMPAASSRAGISTLTRADVSARRGPRYNPRFRSTINAGNAASASADQIRETKHTSPPDTNFLTPADHFFLYPFALLER